MVRYIKRAKTPKNDVFGLVFNDTHPLLDIRFERHSPLLRHVWYRIKKHFYHGAFPNTGTNIFYINNILIIGSRLFCIIVAIYVMRLFVESIFNYYLLLRYEQNLNQYYFLQRLIDQSRFFGATRISVITNFLSE